MNTMDVTARIEFEEHLKLLDRSTTRINRVLFEVLQRVGLQLLDLDSVHTAEARPLLTFMISQFPKPNECNACTDFVHLFPG